MKYLNTQKGETKMKRILAFTIASILCTSMFSMLPTPVKAENGLVGYWKFDESSGTTATDSSGNGNTGTVNGSQWVDGIEGRALRFDGVDDYVYVPHSSSLDLDGYQMSVEFWMNLGLDWYYDINHENMCVYDKGDAYTSSLIADSGALRYNLAYVPVRETPETAKSSWAANTWFFVAEVYNDPYIEIYLNGVLDNSEPVTGPIPHSGFNLCIGAHSLRIDQIWFNGAIDEFAIYNYARTAEEILAEYNSVSHGPVGYWKFDEGLGTKAIDSSGNGHDGTIVNATYTNDVHQPDESFALEFNNTVGELWPAESYVTVLDDPDLRPSSGFTVEAWIKAFEAGGACTTIIAKECGPAENDSWTLWYNWDGWLGFAFTSLHTNSIGTAFPTMNKWHHVAGTWDGLTMRLYVDGKEVANKPFTGPIVYDGNPIIIGADDNNGDDVPDEGWNGLIDEVKIFGYARTSEELWKDYFSAAGFVEVATMSARLPVGAQVAASIWNGSHAYIFGGVNQVSGALDQILRYDSNSDTIETMSAVLPDPVADFPAVWTGQYAYIFGGWMAQGATSDKIVRYDPSTDSVTVMNAKLPTYSFPVYSMSAVWDGNYAYLFGGYDGYSFLDQIMKYDPVQDQLTILSSHMPTPIKWNSAVWTGEYAYIFGGLTPSGNSDKILKYDPVSDTVTEASARLPFKLGVMSAVWSGKYAYIFGGGSGEDLNSASDRVVRYDPALDSVVVFNEEKLPSPRRWTCSVWNGSCAYVFGGESGGLDLDEVIRVREVTYDIAVAEIVTSKTGCWPIPTIGQGSALSINVTVENQGDVAQDFNVTIYANMTTLQTQTVSGLGPNSSVTLTFDWNTTSFTKGNYTIAAYAGPATHETDTADNTIVGEMLAVVAPGDINADGLVDIFDIVRVAVAFSSTPISPSWDPNADINGDGTIDIFDIVVVALHFGETS